MALCVCVCVCVCHMHASFPVGRTLERDVPTEQSCKGQCIMAPTEIPPCNWTMVATLPNLTKFHVPLTIDLVADLGVFMLAFISPDNF